MTLLRRSILWAALIFLTGTHAPAQPARDGFRPGRLIIQPRANHHAPTLANLNNIRGRRVLRTFKNLNNLQLIELAPGTDVHQARREYEASGLVDFAEPDYFLYPAATPNDPSFIDGSQWQFLNTGQSGGLADADIDGPEAWDTLRSASNIIVAIVDTGIRTTHEDLAANLWVNPDEIPGNNIDDDDNGIIDDIHGLNAAANSGNPVDLDGHGTQVASAAGAVGNNGVGISGVAWQVQIMACRFYDNSGGGSIVDAVTCFDYARSKGAHIVNASFVSTVFSSALSSAITRLRDAGIIVVAAAGNDAINNDTTPYYPANYSQDNVVAVCSTTRSDFLSGFSNYGATSVDLAAPGSALRLAYHSGDSAYVINNGTSFASPMVAGALALIKARFPNETHRQLIDRLLAATDRLPGLAGRCASEGRLNLATAIGPSLAADFTSTPSAGAPPLDVQFTDTSFGPVTGWQWDFGDGTTSTAPSPSHRYEHEGIFIVTLTVNTSSGLTHRIERELAILPNYTISSGTYSWVNPSGMTALTLSNDGVSPAQALPFPFSFYGRPFDSLYVGANGLAGFINQNLASSANHSLPNPSTPNALLCPFWDNLNPASGGDVYIGTTGSAPNRRTVVTWSNVRHASGPAFNPDFQLLLEEASQRIVFQYLDVVRSGNPGSRGGSATVGIEDASGTVAAQYSINGTQQLSDGQAIVFSPGSTGGILVTPTLNLAFNGDPEGPFTPSDQSYSIVNTSSNPLTWSASHDQPWLSVSPLSGSLPPGQTAILTVSIQTNSLPPGRYVGHIEIVHDAGTIGNAIRTATLTVDGTIGTLEVTPASAFLSSGITGDPPTPASTVYTMANIGDTAIQWSASITSSWASLSLTGGLLPAGATTNVTISINAAAQLLPSGVHLDQLTLSNLTHGIGSTNRLLALNLSPPPPGTLAVLPQTGFDSRGAISGPFLPASHSFTLTNLGSAGFEWTVQTSADWITLSPSSSTLDGHLTTNITALINGNASLLPTGSHPALIQFINLTSGKGNTNRIIQLLIDPPARLEALPPANPGWFDFTLIGSPASRYVIEATANPINWIPVSTNTTGPDGRALLSQPIVPPFQFFRARPE